MEPFPIVRTQDEWSNLLLPESHDTVAELTKFKTDFILYFLSNHFGTYTFWINQVKVEFGPGIKTGNNIKFLYQKPFSEMSLFSSFLLFHEMEFLHIFYFKGYVKSHFRMDNFITNTNLVRILIDGKALINTNLTCMLNLGFWKTGFYSLNAICKV